MATVLKNEETLRKQEDSLRTENVFLHYAAYGELAAGGLLCLYGGFTLVNSGSYAFLVLGGILLFLGVAHRMKRGENEESVDKISSGRSGEEFVSDLLEENLPDEFYLINDLDVSAGGRTAQNDHLVVGPGGIFLVETKAYAGTLTGTAEDEHWTQKKEHDTNKVTNPIAQSAYHREVLEDFLQAKNLPFGEADVHEFIAMVNKQCEWHVEGARDTVDYAWNIPAKIAGIGKEQKYDENTRNNLVSELGVEPPAESESDNTGDHTSDPKPSTKEHSREDDGENRDPEEDHETDSARRTDSGASSRNDGKPDDPDAQWWVYRNGSVSDRTYTTEELKELDLNPETKICRAGQETWRSLREIDNLP